MVTTLRLKGGTVENLRANAQKADREQSRAEQSVRNGTSRTCTKCGGIKPLKAFYGMYKGQFSRLTKSCGACRAIAKKNLRAKRGY